MAAGTIAKLGAVLVVLLSAARAAADPGYYLLVPYSAAGVLALDVRYWSVHRPGRQATLWPELGLRYGFSTQWTSELLASYIGNSLREQKLSSLNWQNTYVLTEGQYPFDLALHAQLIRNHGEGNALELGPLFQTELGLTQLNLNLVFERNWARTDGTRLKYQWQALHRLDAGVRLGLQGFGELGPWDDWSDRQSHRAGPVLRLRLGDRLEMQAAYLWGTTYGRRGDMFSAHATWGF